MNELGDLLINSKRVKYKVSMELSPKEYRLLLFSIGDQERYYNHSSIEGHEAFFLLKEKLIVNHNMFNKNWENKNAST